MGCSAAQGPSVAWITQNGGLTNESYQARAERVAHNLLCCCQGRPVTVLVLASDKPAAFSWRDGHVYMTRGLMDRLNDADLSAVVAHELGHLIDNGAVHAPCCLSGSASDADVEVRADAYGTDVLKKCGIPPEAMIRMLQKFKATGALPPATQSAIDRRIALLQTRLESPSRS
jgi:predicted Zn-dependent protease